MPHHSDAYDWKLIDRNALRNESKN